MFKNLILLPIAGDWPAPSADAVEQALARRPFVDCGATERESTGWVAPRGDAHGRLLESVGGQWIVALRTQVRLLPASVLREELERRLRAAAAQLGFEPKGARRRELKEQVEHEMLPRAFTKTTTTLAWIDPDARRLAIAAGSVKKAERVSSALVEAFADAGGALPLAPLHTQLSPPAAMSAWLRTREAPRGFSVDRDCELKSAEGEGATVRYARHPLDLDEVVGHVEQGKQATRLALTWADRVSFVLGADGALRRLALLDLAAGAREGGGDHEDFDADVALWTGQLRRLLPDLIDALGGEQPVSLPASA